MLDLVMIDGHAKGIITRNLITGKIERHGAHAVILATGGYGNVFYLSTNAMGSNATAAWRAHRKGALFANPCYTQIHPTCIPVSGAYQSKLTLMSESLRNDGRVWVPKTVALAEKIRKGELTAIDIKEVGYTVCFFKRHVQFFAASSNIHIFPELLAQFSYHAACFCKSLGSS